jgi:hypothetical protein
MSVIYATFEGNGSAEGLSLLCFRLLSAQKESWPLLGQGYRALEKVRVREIVCAGFTVRIQHNPGRSTSTLASVEDNDVRSRPCFLCLRNLPVEQKGILYQGRYLILCNPTPVLPGHLTIAHLKHQPQSMDREIHTFLQLITDLGEDWIVLYNGPKCGASAPDHLHFQAIPAGNTPLERELSARGMGAPSVISEGVSFCSLRGMGRSIAALTGSDSEALGKALRSYLNGLAARQGLSEEPMVNIAGLQREDGLHLYIFPRSKHRPYAFFREGDERVLVSPAIIEMMGIFVTPAERDFDRLTADAVTDIYREVCIQDPPQRLEM